MNVTKTAIRKAVGRKPFTVTELATALEVTSVTARKHIARLVDAEKVEPVAIRQTGKRGRPAQEYKVLAGK